MLRSCIYQPSFSCCFYSEISRNSLYILKFPLLNHSPRQQGVYQFLGVNNLNSQFSWLKRLVIYYFKLQNIQRSRQFQSWSVQWHNSVTRDPSSMFLFRHFHPLGLASLVARQPWQLDKRFEVQTQVGAEMGFY